MPSSTNGAPLPATTNIIKARKNKINKKGINNIERKTDVKLLNHAHPLRHVNAKVRRNVKRRKE
ncbi:hypothetical protein HanRHA438_Chr13g0588311 [Helianthus annuus]|nr:hypothetical protein HanRHA438_Chr13g0588311 [Helianthus annuus]